MDNKRKLDESSSSAQHSPAKPESLLRKVIAKKVGVSGKSSCRERNVDLFGIKQKQALLNKMKTSSTSNIYQEEMPITITQNPKLFDGSCKMVCDNKVMSAITTTTAIQNGGKIKVGASKIPSADCKPTEAIQALEKYLGGSTSELEEGSSNKENYSGFGLYVNPSSAAYTVYSGVTSLDDLPAKLLGDDVLDMQEEHKRKRGDPPLPNDLRDVPLDPVLLTNFVELDLATFANLYGVDGSEKFDNF